MSVRYLLLLAWALLVPQIACAQQSQPFHLVSANTTNCSNIKPAAGQIVTVFAANTTSTIYYLKFYDSALSPPVAGTTTVTLTLPVPAAQSSTGGGFILPLPQAVQFLNGIGMCITGGIADNDSSSAATGLAIDVFFK
jgi:hypothetical protein